MSKRYIAVLTGLFRPRKKYFKTKKAAQACVDNSVFGGTVRIPLTKKQKLYRKRHR